MSVPSKETDGCKGMRKEAKFDEWIEKRAKKNTVAAARLELRARHMMVRFCELCRYAADGENKDGLLDMLYEWMENVAREGKLQEKKCWWLDLLDDDMVVIPNWLFTETEHTPSISAESFGSAATRILLNQIPTSVPENLKTVIEFRLLEFEETVASDLVSRFCGRGFESHF